MGFDVSFHPISPAEMDMWYFTPLEWVRQGQKDKVLDLAEQYGMEAFSCAEVSQRAAGGGRCGGTGAV